MRSSCGGGTPAGRRRSTSRRQRSRYSDRLLASLRGSPETLRYAGGLVGVADAVEVLGHQEPDLRERLEHRPLTVHEREAHPRQLLPAGLERGGHGRQAGVELLPLLGSALDDRRDQAVKALPPPRRALRRRLSERDHLEADLGEAAPEQPA